MSVWVRVNKDFRCAICNRADWCRYSPKFKGYQCMRIVSNHPMLSGGYWHLEPKTENPMPLPKATPEPPAIDAESILRECQTFTKSEWISTLAVRLGVSYSSLMALGCVWIPRRVIQRYQEWRGDGSWGFPMRNGEGRPVGIRLRTNGGRKISIRGGKEGIFVPDRGWSSTAWMGESPTELAAILTLGLWGLGRPNCRGGIAHTQVAINRLHIKRIINVANNDLPHWENDRSPGLEGARALANELQVPVATVVLPTKDLRQFVIDGGTVDVLNAMIQHLNWKEPK